jgi:hypothetical protein
VAGDKNSKDRRIRHILLGSVPTTHLWLLSFVFPYVHNRHSQGANLVTLPLPPVGSPWFSDSDNGNWWIGFLVPFCFYIIPNFSKPCLLCLLPTSCWFLPWLILQPIDGGDMLLWNIRWL